MSTETEHERVGNNIAEELDRRLAIFKEHLFARLASDALEVYPESRRDAIARSAYEFFANRSEAIKVRVAPAPANDGIIFVETAMPDCPFIVDSILEFFRHSDLPVQTILHPLYEVTRSASGEIVSFEQAAAGERPESFTHAEVELGPAKPSLTEIQSGLVRVLTQVREATSDFGAMTARALQICEETARRRELVEIRDFLRWLVHNGFVFLGYRRYRVANYDGNRAIALDSGLSLGIMRSETRSRYSKPVPLNTLEDAHRKLLFEGPPLVIGKTHAESEVHRRAAMDDITLRRNDARGQVVGFDRFIGLFTSKAYSEEAAHIPVLRAKLNELIAMEQFEPGTHDYKALVAAFNSFPKEELFRARVAELRSQLGMVLDVKNETDVRLSLETDEVRGNVIALIIMPREQFSAEVRMRIQQALSEHLRGSLVYYFLALGDSYTARLHFCFAAAPPAASVVPELRAEIARLARSWNDLLREHLIARFGAARGNTFAAKWLNAFTPNYKSATPVELAIADIEQFEQLSDARRFSVLIGPAGAEAHPDSSHLRLYELGEAPILSDLVPVLQNFGISVLSEEAYEFRRGSEEMPERAYVQAFHVRSAEGQALERAPGASLIAEALVAVRTDLADDDPLNALTLAAGLSWREVALVRTYIAAAFQMKLGAARAALRRPMLLYPHLARAFVDYFKARFDPAHETPANRLNELRAGYIDRLASIDNIADDRLARTLISMIDATVRTNYFCDTEASRAYTVLKFESGKIPNLPDAPPLYEIHVNSRHMEGCHLRGGKVARGGIRFSDRPDDYRTEILELMKTQTVKNAIIVPVGAKGGFVVKTRADRSADRQAVVSAYTTLIEAMLDVTDNLVEDRAIHPPRVKVSDTDGAYLVVAADKGTAEFSDIANEIAERRGFWLRDAFASGGEHGYDHKKMGITARGAWESAKRHLREMGRDIVSGEPIIMVGIGDMSGDVFGNGLLQSENIKLVAAFDHRHIFIDPSPDPRASFAERKRLYEKAHSQWSDYNPDLISKGGGVYRRGQKQIQLSAEARSVLQCNATEIDADSLIQAILRAPVDMLYNGGVGTYVRATDENEAEVGDHANDSCRVAAGELRCKIVVEGGNLGFTQAARIEYALNGGRINTDAIDNSAGVDMSDHEVNLKILLQPVVTRGALTFEERNRHLAVIAEEVAANVLRNNRDQVLLLSLEQIRSRGSIVAFRDHMTAIDQRGVLGRHETVLPTHEELQERRSRFSGLTRPELALLTAYTKIDLTKRLEHTALIDDPYLVERFLRPYFPGSIVQAFGDDIPRHRLRRELIATRLVNELVDLMGSTFVFNLIRDFGIEAEEAVRAWLIVDGILDLGRRAEAIKADAIAYTAGAELEALLGLAQAARRACAWAISDAAASMPVGEIAARMKPRFDKLAGEFETTLRGGERTLFESTYRTMRTAVHKEEIAHELARLSFAEHLLNVLTISLARNIDPMEVATVYFGMSDQFEFAMLEAGIDSIRSDDQWERRAARDLDGELTWARIQLCRSHLEERSDGSEPRTGQIVGGRERRVRDVARLMNDLRALQSVGLPPLQVTVRALARLASNT